MTVDLSPTVVGRLTRESLFWLATVHPTGTPHLAPLWYLWYEESIFIFTGGAKLHNMRTNPLVSLALQDGLPPLILEGEGVQVMDHTAFDQVAAHYRARFAWDISHETDSM